MRLVRSARTCCTPSGKFARLPCPIWQIFWINVFLSFASCCCACDMVKHPPHVTDSAALCSTLKHTAPHCNTLHHTAPHYNTLQHTATHVKDSSVMSAMIMALKSSSGMQLGHAHASRLP